MKQQEGFCDLLPDVKHEKVSTCENWRPVIENGFCDIVRTEPHRKMSDCQNWRPGAPIPVAVPLVIKQGISAAMTALAKPEKPRHAVGVSVLLIENGKLLLGKRGPGCGAAKGMFSTPGGRLEIEESFEDCARREFFEETGATLQGPLKILGYKKHFRFGEHYIMFYVFSSSYIGVIGNPEGPEKCEGWRWIDSPDLFFYDLPVTEPKDILFEAFAEAERRK